jgi:2-polyprenyl-3-methyl-5-hydroxy-6-metoxy-1,4-benzoquinol methylase
MSTSGNAHPNGKPLNTNDPIQPLQPTCRNWSGWTGLSSLLYLERRNTVLSLFDELGLKNARVLEVSCGPGITSVLLGRRGHTVYAIDTVPAMIDLTRKHAADSQMAGQILAAIGDIRAIDFAGSTFDVAIVVGVTEGLTALEQPMRELTRVLKPGGFLIVTGENTWSLNLVLDPLLTPIFNPIRRLVIGAMRWFGRRLRTHSVLRSVSQLDFAIRAAGLQIVRRTTVGFGPFTFAGKKLLSDSTSWKLHQRFQVFADHGWPVLRSTGNIYIALAKKAE